MDVLFHIFYYYWGKENRSLYRGLRYTEVPLSFVAFKLSDRQFYIHVGFDFFNEFSTL